MGTIANTTVAENVAFTGSTPVISGDTPIGTLTYTLGGTDVTEFTINSTTGVIAMVARDFEAPADTGSNNAYEVTIIATDSDGNTANTTQTVTVTDVYEAPFSSGSGDTFNGKFYLTVTSLTGRVWLDRNLGATQVCADADGNGIAGPGDEACFGDYYQWGRAADGHDSSASDITPTLASSITPGTNTFVTNNSALYDWTAPGVDDGTIGSDGSLRTAAWEDGGDNDICPAGFSVPLMSELETERASWATSDAGAFGSNLKIPTAGYRSRTDGVVQTGFGVGGYMWGRDAASFSYYTHFGSSLYFNASSSSSSSATRAHGHSIRCIKD
jgi:hypothetical protein